MTSAPITWEDFTAVELCVGTILEAELVTGFRGEDGAVVLAVPEQRVPNGTRLA